MELIVDYDRLKELGSEINEEEEKIEECLSNLLKISEDFKNCWKGKDFEEFISNIETYISNEKESAKRIKTFGDILSKVSDNYREKDYEWLNRLKEKEQDE